MRKTRLALRLISLSAALTGLLIVAERVWRHRRLRPDTLQRDLERFENEGGAVEAHPSAVARVPVPTDEGELATEIRHANSLHPDELIATAESLGWTRRSNPFDADPVFEKPGRRSLTIRRTLAAGDAWTILQALQSDSDAGGE